MCKCGHSWVSGCLFLTLPCVELVVNELPEYKALTLSQSSECLWIFVGEKELLLLPSLLLSLLKDIVLPHVLQSFKQIQSFFLENMLLWKISHTYKGGGNSITNSREVFTQCQYLLIQRLNLISPIPPPHVLPNTKLFLYESVEDKGS